MQNKELIVSIAIATATVCVAVIGTGLAIHGEIDGIRSDLTKFMLQEKDDIASIKDGIHSINETIARHYLIDSINTAARITDNVQTGHKDYR